MRFDHQKKRQRGWACKWYSKLRSISLIPEQCGLRNCPLWTCTGSTWANTHSLLVVEAPKVVRKDSLGVCER